MEKKYCSRLVSKQITVNRVIRFHGKNLDWVFLTNRYGNCQDVGSFEAAKNKIRLENLTKRSIFFADGIS